MKNYPSGVVRCGGMQKFPRHQILDRSIRFAFPLYLGPQLLVQLLQCLVEHPRPRLLVQCQPPAVLQPLQHRPPLCLRQRWRVELRQLPAGKRQVGLPQDIGGACSASLLAISMPIWKLLRAPPRSPCTSPTRSWLSSRAALNTRRWRWFCK